MIEKTHSSILVIFCYLFFSTGSSPVKIYSQTAGMADAPITLNASLSQGPGLILGQDDIRLEEYFSDNEFVGYMLTINKKPGLESVILTESTATHALRDTKFNPVNGNEIRHVNGAPLNYLYARFSITSSEPQPDDQFGRAFKLLLPYHAVYGNPESANGMESLYIENGVIINVRTFDHKYADPKPNSFIDNLIRINGARSSYSHLPHQFGQNVMDITVAAQPLNDNLDILRAELVRIGIDREHLHKEDSDLRIFLRNMFKNRSNENGE